MRCGSESLEEAPEDEVVPCTVHKASDESANQDGGSEEVCDYVCLCASDRKS